MGECIPKPYRQPASLRLGGVTPEMREAGAEVLMTYREVLDSESLAAEVYSAMVLQETFRSKD